ncbi:Fur family transcriptional regulator [Paraburkholderia sp.]|uniref:Fur family transcriptional regulator n=1 Tax=Paraburkholderia sp. TaxID=1926495 RepID=UPI0039E3AF0F
MGHVVEETRGQQGLDPAPYVETRLALARVRCEQRGVRLTPLRAAVLEVLLRQEKFVTAYELVDRLRKRNQVVPPMTVYRVLDFLIAQGLVHRLDTVNGYIPVRDVPDSGRYMVTICTRCAKVREVDTTVLGIQLDEELARAGLTRDSSVVEVRVICDRCRS